MSFYFEKSFSLNKEVKSLRKRMKSFGYTMEEISSFSDGLIKHNRDKILNSPCKCFGQNKDICPRCNILFLEEYVQKNI